MAFHLSLVKLPGLVFQPTIIVHGEREQLKEEETVGLIESENHRIS